jgi:hypothetical protein
MMKHSTMCMSIAFVAAAFLAGCGGREADRAEPSGTESQLTDASRTIVEQLTERREASRARIPAEAREVMEGATNDLRQSGIIDGALNVGAKIPRFVLNDAVGNPINVEDLLADGPLVVTFYRGGW